MCVCLQFDTAGSEDLICPPGPFSVLPRARSRAFPLVPCSHQGRALEAPTQLRRHPCVRWRSSQPSRAQSAAGSIVVSCSRCKRSALLHARPNTKSGDGSRRTRYDGKTSGTVFLCSRRRRRVAGRRLSCGASTLQTSHGSRACTVARRIGLASIEYKTTGTTRARIRCRAVRRATI